MNELLTAPFVTGVGSMPGATQADYDEAVRVVLGSLEQVPFVPEVPGRGPYAGITGRAVAVMAHLGADLQPAGWRLTDALGLDQRRARSLLAQDLDTLEHAIQSREVRPPVLKTQVCGPWTLAATVEKPRGDRVLADHGARRDLAAALAEGVASHVADLRSRSGGSEIWAQLDEPALRSVLDARVPTASGFGRHRSIEPAEASAGLSVVIDAAHAAGARVVVHSCSDDVPVGLIRGAGADAVSLDAALLRADGLDALGSMLDDDGSLLLGVLPTDEAALTRYASDGLPEPADIARRAQRVLNEIADIGELGGRFGVTPACGLAGATPPIARTAWPLLADVAARLTDQDH